MSTTREKTVLIADDDPGQLLLVEAALAGAGFIVTKAVDGAEAVATYATSQVDCVILDLNMPNLDGIGACRAIRQHADGRLLPILMLTGRNDLTAITDAYAAGASDFAQKGLNPRLLVERVRFLLRDRELQDQLWASRSKLLMAQRIARVGHWEIDVEGRSIDVSPFIQELLETGEQSLARYDDFIAMLEAPEQEAVRVAFQQCASGKGGYSFDHRLRTAAGTDVWVHQEAELIVPSGGGSRGVAIVTLQDLTRLRRAEEAVRTLSYFDGPTGLPNHRYLAEHVTLALKEETPAQALGVVTFRLHNFDHAVHAQGVQFANALTAEVARGIEAELGRVGVGRAIVWHEDVPTVCRVGDGELAVLIRSRVSQQHIETVTHAILTAVSKPTVCLDTELVPVLSAGIALAPGDGSDADQLLGNARVAAEQAVDARSCAFFSPAPRARSRRRLELESALRGAIERGEMYLVYQPRVAIDTLELMGVESLLRWQHPQFGAVSPQEFLPIAEQNGSIEEIGHWVVFRAACQAVSWREQFSRSFFVSTNLSGRQLRNPALVGQIGQALETSGLPPQALEIELTETSILEAPDEVRQKLTALRSLGVRVAIDDFGVGYSSLSQIRQLQFDSMKLDRALTADLYADLGAQGVTAAVIAMARALRTCSVAEGVEDAATLAMLRALGCDEIQGHYVSQPLSVPEFEQWIAAGGAAALVRHDALDLDAQLASGEGRTRRSKRPAS